MSVPASYWRPDGERWPTHKLILEMYWAGFTWEAVGKAVKCSPGTALQKARRTLETMHAEGRRLGFHPGIATRRWRVATPSIRVHLNTWEDEYVRGSDQTQDGAGDH